MESFLPLQIRRAYGIIINWEGIILKHTLRPIRLALALLAVLAAFLLLCGAARADGLTVHFLDIDRNDGILIECDGEVAFIDGGLPEFAQRAINYMQARGITHLKYYIGTHAHKDHVAGGAWIIKAMSPDAVLQMHDGVRALIIKEAENAKDAEIARGAQYITATVGQTYTIGGAQLTIIGPLNVHRYEKYTTLENYNSMVARLTYGSRTFLLTGDSMGSPLTAIDAANPGALKCDVMKNPHHDGALRPAVMALFEPEYVVFSTSDKFLPAQETLHNVANLGALALVTAPKQNGTVVFHTDGTSLTHTTANGPQAITLNKQEITIYEGKNQSVHAHVTPSSFRAFVYTSLDPAIATVDGSGRVTGVAPGTATIRALTSNNLYADCTVTVLPVSVKLNQETLSVYQGKTGSLRATILPAGTRGKTVTWTSDDPAVAVVSASGRVTGVTPGETTIRATLQNGSQAACAVTVMPVKVSSVRVSPGSATVTIGQTKQLTATVSPSNATDKHITWTSADEGIVTIDAGGLLTAVGVGRTTVTANAADGKTRVVNVTVKPVYVTSIKLTSDGKTVFAGVAGKNTTQLSAEIQPANATIQDIAWKSSNPRIATVDENGLVTGLREGRATITATAQDGSRRRISLRVTVEPNHFLRKTALMRDGELVVSAREISYVRDKVKVILFYANRSGEPVQVPGEGILTFILPDGRKLPLIPMKPSRNTVRSGRISQVTVYLPLATYPQLTGLDLTSCDATVE